MVEDALVQRISDGHAASGARLIRWLEDRDPRALPVLAALFPQTGRAHIVGVTGPPGAGKSTLVDGLIGAWRQAGRRVGVIAVDPSSPFTGGALLGDRVRLQRHATDPDVFIRSMATRGQLGGLSRASWDASVVLDAMGFDPILIETIGVGQDELDVVAAAHTTLVVCPPDAGDEVQALKAGIREVGDVLVLNKADLPGANATEKDLLELLHLRGEQDGWAPPLLRTVAARGDGLAELAERTDAHAAHLRARDAFARTSQELAVRAFRDRVRERAAAQLLHQDAELTALLARVRERAQDPYSAADAWLAHKTAHEEER